MTERCCETCVHYPPSSFGGKPCSCCEPSDPMTSCWDGRPEESGESKMAEYIDRKTALSFPFANGKYDHEHANKHFIFGCESYKEWLETLPPADVQPVRRGRWLKTDAFPHRVYCSECYKTYVPNDNWQIWQDKPGEGGLQRTYCPACGAKMEQVVMPDGGRRRL